MVCSLPATRNASCTPPMSCACAVRQFTNARPRPRSPEICAAARKTMSSARPDEHVASTLYYDAAHAKEAVKILPGEYYVTNADMILVTVLGSCVSACIRDPKAGVAGMNHFMLPDARDGDGVLSASARYGSYAMELLINQLLK